MTGASVLVVDGSRALIIKRGKEPSKGLWALPGGSQELGETLEQAAIRELKEETGLDALSISFLTFLEPMKFDDQGQTISHYVLAVFVCREFTGEVLAGDDAQEACWVTLQTLGDFSFTGTSKSILLEHLTQL